jgi:hypothetical protein
MPVLPQGQSAGGSIADLLGGVDRPQLNAFVANSQARNGLVSAQTQDAMVKASQTQEQMQAWENIKQDLIKNGAPESEATLTRDALVAANNHDPVTAMKTLALAKLGYGSPASQVQGQQMDQGKIAGLEAAPPNFVTPTAMATANANPNGAAPPIGQTPEAAAQTNEYNALAGLNAHKNTTPQDFRNPAVFGTLTPDGQAALTKAISEGRLDPTRVNARNAPILAQTELQAPGTNFNRMHADAALQSNATFQQRAMSVDMLPGLLSHTTALGKKLNGGSGYSDIKTVGQMQQFMNGQLNDPDYTEYMTARNDTLLRLASVMRGVGMSDQAHTAEVQAMSPTLAPYALDAWLKGQMSVVQPLLDRQNRITHLGEAGQGTQPLTPSGPGGSPAPAAPQSLGDTLPTPQGAPPAAPTDVPSFPDEASARAALGPGVHRVKIGGVTGTLH